MPIFAMIFTQGQNPISFIIKTFPVQCKFTNIVSPRMKTKL